MVLSICNLLPVASQLLLGYTLHLICETESEGAGTESSIGCGYDVSSFFDIRTMHRGCGQASGKVSLDTAH